MKKLLPLGALLASLISLSSLSACGQKGPLYLPDTAPNTTTTKNANTAAPQQP